MSYQNKCKHHYTGATARSFIRCGDNTQHLNFLTATVFPPPQPKILTTIKWYDIVDTISSRKAVQESMELSYRDKGDVEAISQWVWSVVLV